MFVNLPAGLVLYNHFRPAYRARWLYTTNLHNGRRCGQEKGQGQAEALLMDDTRVRGATSVILRLPLLHSTTFQGLTGLDHTSSGLIISTVTDNEAGATAYTVAGSKLETIATLGTYAAPTATKARFKAVDGTNHPGLYELQLADARFAVASARWLLITLSGATNLLQRDYAVRLIASDLDTYDFGFDAFTLKRGMQRRFGT